MLARSFNRLREQDLKTKGEQSKVNAKGVLERPVPSIEFGT